MIRVVIASDNEAFSQTIAQVLDSQPDVAVVGVGATVEKAFRQAQRLRPDLLLTDMYLADGTGVELAGRVRKAGLGIQVIGFSVADDPSIAQRMLAAGAAAFVSKFESVGVLLNVIRKSVAV